MTTYELPSNDSLPHGNEDDPAAGWHATTNLTTTSPVWIPLPRHRMNQLRGFALKCRALADALVATTTRAVAGRSDGVDIDSDAVGQILPTPQDRLT